jgi:KaiC/GvpD/RAD55 family RecA-like ATPase
MKMGLIVSCLPVPRIPLIDDLTDSQIPPGSNILVEFDPASQWYNASLSIAAGWLRTGGRMGYYAVSKPPDSVRSQLGRFGIDVGTLEAEESLAIYDMYTCQLGQKSKEKIALESLKVSDLSIWLSRALKLAAPDPNLLWIVDSFSPITRFNDEKSFIEWVLTRVIPYAPMEKSIGIWGVLRGVHSDWVYKQLEASPDAVVDFKLEETSEDTKDLIRIRSMRNIHFDRKWHSLRMNDNFEITLEKLGAG